MEKQGLQISPMLGTTELLKTGQASDQNLATSMSSGKQTCKNYKKNQNRLNNIIFVCFSKDYLSYYPYNQCIHRKKLLTFTYRQNNLLKINGKIE